MTIFEQLAERATELDKLGNEYLDKLPFLSNKEVFDRLCEVAHKIFLDAKQDWDAVPDAVATIVEGTMPFWGVPRNGSLRYVLGFSMASQDAHLRNLLEIFEGRETEYLSFPTVAELA